MDRQPKVKYQKSTPFFADGRAAREPVEGTVPMGYSIPSKAGAPTAQDLAAAITSQYGYFSRGQDYTNTGIIDGEWGDGLPMEATPALLARGKERFQINCAICHGDLGDGAGVISKYNYSPPIANLLQDTFRSMPDGQIFHVITHGKGPEGQWTMFPYADKITVEDRWAIVAYVRALQKSTRATLADVPEEHRKTLESK
jgi:mono/diheme cytochrome c family protein